MLRGTGLALAGVVLLGPHVVSAQTVLTLADVLAKAREQAPQIVSARLALAEARGRVIGVSIRQQANPEFDVHVGNRQANGLRITDLEFGAVQMFEPSRRRAARIAGATAQLDQATASADETTREILREAASWFYQAVYASERIRLLTASEALAKTIYDTADRRYRAGDIAVLDVNLARAASARVRSDREGGRRPNWPQPSAACGRCSASTTPSPCRAR